MLSTSVVAGGKSLRDSYVELLKASREQEIKVPIVNVGVLAPQVGLTFMIIALCIATVFVQTVYRIREGGVSNEEPWLPVQGWQPRNSIERVVGKVLTILGIGALVLAILLPLATILVVRVLVNPWLTGAAILFAVACASFSLRETWQLIKENGRTSDPPAVISAER